MLTPNYFNAIPVSWEMYYLYFNYKTEDCIFILRKYCIIQSRGQENRLKTCEKKEEQYQVLRPDELPSSADINGSVGSSSVCIAYTFFLQTALDFASLRISTSQYGRHKKTHIMSCNVSVTTKNIKKRNELKMILSIVFQQFYITNIR